MRQRLIHPPLEHQQAPNPPYAAASLGFSSRARLYSASTSRRCQRCMYTNASASGISVSSSRTFVGASNFLRISGHGEPT